MMQMRTVVVVLGLVLVTALGCGGAKDQGGSEVLTKQSEEPESDMVRMARIVDGLRGNWKFSRVYFSGPSNVDLEDKVALFASWVGDKDKVVANIIANIQEHTVTIQFPGGNPGSCNQKIIFRKVMGRTPCGCAKMIFTYSQSAGEPPLDPACLALAQGLSLDYVASTTTDANELYLSYSVGESSINFDLDLIP